LRLVPHTWFEIHVQWEPDVALTGRGVQMGLSAGIVNTSSEELDVTTSGDVYSSIQPKDVQKQQAVLVKLVQEAQRDAVLLLPEMCLGTAPGGIDPATLAAVQQARGGPAILVAGTRLEPDGPHNRAFVYFRSGRTLVYDNLQPGQLP